MATAQSLINQTIKFLQNNDPERMYSMRVFPDTTSEGGNPVLIFTIGNIFDTAKSIKSGAENIYDGIKGFKNQTEDLRTSLEKLGYQAAGQTLEYIYEAVSSVEEVQTMIKIYKVAKPIVRKLADIGDIAWNFSRIGEIAQDVLAELGKIATSAAKDAIENLWNKFLEIPVFGIYESTQETINLQDAYQEMYDFAESIMSDILNDDKILDDLIRITNDHIAIGKNFMNGEPEYIKTGATIDNDILGTYYDSARKTIYIFDETKIYRLDENWNPVLEYDTAMYFPEDSKEISSIFTDSSKFINVIFKNEDDKVYTLVKSQSYSYSSICSSFDYQIVKVIKCLDFIMIDDIGAMHVFSNEDGVHYGIVGSYIKSDDDSPMEGKDYYYKYKENLRLCEDESLFIPGSMYELDSSVIAESIAYNEKDDIIYVCSDNIVYSIEKSNGIWIIDSLSSEFEDEIKEMAYFNGFLYCLFKNDSNEWNIRKISSDMMFNSTSFNPSLDNPTYIDDKYIIDGNTIKEYKISDSSVNEISESDFENLDSVSKGTVYHITEKNEYVISKKDITEKLRFGYSFDVDQDKVNSGSDFSMAITDREKFDSKINELFGSHDFITFKYTSAGWKYIITDASFDVDEKIVFPTQYPQGESTSAGDLEDWGITLGCSPNINDMFEIYVFDNISDMESGNIVSNIEYPEAENADPYVTIAGLPNYDTWKATTEGSLNKNRCSLSFVTEDGGTTWKYSKNGSEYVSTNISDWGWTSVTANYNNAHFEIDVIPNESGIVSVGQKTENVSLSTPEYSAWTNSVFGEIYSNNTVSFNTKDGGNTWEVAIGTVGAIPDRYYNSISVEGIQTAVFPLDRWGIENISVSGDIASFTITAVEYDSAYGTLSKSYTKSLCDSLNVSFSEPQSWSENPENIPDVLRETATKEIIFQRENDAWMLDGNEIDLSDYGITVIATEPDSSSTGQEFIKDMASIYIDIEAPNKDLYWKTLSSSNTAEITNGNCATFGTSPTCVTKAVLPGTDYQYYIASGGLGILVKQIGCTGSKETAKSLNYIPRYIGGEKQNTYPDEPESMIGCTWINSDFYCWTARRIYWFSPINTYTLFTTPVQEDENGLPDAKTRRGCEYFTSTIEKNESELTYTDFFNAPYGYEFVNARNIDGKLYVSLRSIYESGIFKDRNGIYLFDKGIQSIESYTDQSGTIYSNTYYLNPTFTNIVNTRDIVPYSFDKIESEDHKNSWFYVDSEKLYRYSETTGKTREITIAEKSDSNYIISISQKDGKVIVYMNDSILTEDNTNRTFDIDTHVKLGLFEKSIYQNPNSVIIDNGSDIFNITEKRNDIQDELYQEFMYRSSRKTRLESSNWNTFVINGKTLYHLPINSSIKDGKYHCGYYTDNAIGKWAGAAPYFAVENIIDRNANETDRKAFIGMFKESFKTEFDTLMKNCPDALVEYIKNKIIERLRTEKFEFEINDSIIDSMIENISNTISTEASIYINEHFSSKIGDDDTYVKFSEDVYRQCISDVKNNFTDDFYLIFKSILSDILKNIEQSINSINTMSVVEIDSQTGNTSIKLSTMRELLVSYYQRHKYEFAKMMTDKIDVDKVDNKNYKDFILSGDFPYLDMQYHNSFYDAIEDKWDDIAVIKGSKTGTISQEDKEAMKNIISLQTNIMVPDDEWINTIEMVVDDIYKPIQEQQFISYIKNANMYPIKWNELPEKINREFFEDVLNRLLEEIRNSIIENIIILITKGKVRCFSCIDSESVVLKIRGENDIICYNAKNIVLDRFNNANNWSEIVPSILSISRTSKNTLSSLNKILDAQSSLYAKYADMLITEQAINTDKDTDMEMEV